MEKITLALLASAGLTLSACQSIPTPAQTQAFSALNSAWPPVHLQANAGAEYLLSNGDINEAGKAVLDARTEAFGQLLADLLSGGK